MEASERNVAAGGGELSDAALVELYRGDGGEVAFGELIRRHQIPVFRLLLGLLGDADTAERACEQAFFEAARRLDELGEPSGFHAWVVGIARATADKITLERARASKRQAKKPGKGPPTDPRAMLKQEVRGILSELTNEERVALLLADLEGDSFAAIGETLGTNAEEAERIVTRARTRFVRDLGRSEAPPEEAARLPEKHWRVEPGDVLGNRYRIVVHLGQGGMGEVFRAVEIGTGRDVAIKTLLPEAAKDPALRRRFALEAEAIRRVEHPNFVRFIEFRQEPAEPAYVVMEFVEGSALDKVLKSESRLAAARALHVIRHVLSGLGHAHSMGVVHRDMKPGNVMLTEADDDPEFAKILDLGVARLMGPDDVQRTRLTQRGELFGTPVYMSPEQVRGDDIDGRSDLYSVTVMLYEMLASRPPFQSKSATGLFAMHLAGQPPPLAEAAPDLAVPQALQDLIDVGLSKEPEQRFRSADDFLNRLDAVAELELGTIAPDRPRAERRRATAVEAASPSAPDGVAFGSAAQAPAARRRPTFAQFAVLVVLLALLVWFIVRP